MKLLVAALAALTLAAPAAAHQKHQHRWKTMTQAERLQTVNHEIQMHRPPVRFWIHNHSRIPFSVASGFVMCRALGTHAPGAICIHAQHVVKALHVRTRIITNIAAAQRRAELRAIGGNDFLTAAAYADRIFPGTYHWLEDCSSSEGGHGGWVPNRGGSGAGGWMQFMSGTFYGNVGGAFAEAASRGYPLPSSARSWYSPLGQAVTAAWMRYHGTDAGQWTGVRC